MTATLRVRCRNSETTDGFAGLPGASVSISVTVIVRAILALLDWGSDAVNATVYVLAAS